MSRQSAIVSVQYVFDAFYVDVFEVSFVREGKAALRDLFALLPLFKLSESI